MPVQNSFTVRKVIIALFGSLLLQGCAQVNLKRMTYEALRQQDCRMNEPDSFCSRGFAMEYNEYERVRQDYLRTDALTEHSINTGLREFEPIASN